MRILVAGWFSFRQMGNSAGDMITLDIVTDWLRSAGMKYDVAVHEEYAYSQRVDWETLNPADYTDLFFVCGPFGNGWPVDVMLERFSHARLTGINLSLLQSLNEWNPFTLLFERDSDFRSKPDISFAGKSSRVPVVGLIQISKQDEYGNRDLYRKANEAMEAFTNSRAMSVVRIDTVLHENSSGLRTAEEIESLVARMDVVLTSRLHGTVLALKNHVPAIPVDPVRGGAKISRQVEALGWPLLFLAEYVTQKDLATAFDYCLTPEARLKTAECTAKAIRSIEKDRLELLSRLGVFKNDVYASRI